MKEQNNPILQKLREQELKEMQMTQQEKDRLSLIRTREELAVITGQITQEQIRNTDSLKSCIIYQTNS